MVVPVFKLDNCYALLLKRVYIFVRQLKTQGDILFSHLHDLNAIDEIYNLIEGFIKHFLVWIGDFDLFVWFEPNEARFIN